MRTSARIFISLGVAAGVFGALVLWTQWGQRNFGPDADSMGIFWLVIAGCFVVLGGLVQAFSKPGGVPVEPVDDGPKEEVDDLGTPLCPSCLAPVERLQKFCDECGVPLTSHAEIDPIGQIRSIGYMVSKAASGPPRLIVVIGIWLIFAVPVVLMLFALEFLGPPDSHGLLDFILRMVLLLGILSLYIAIVIKTTRNYFRKKSELDSARPDAENTADEV